MFVRRRFATTYLPLQARVRQLDMVEDAHEVLEVEAAANEHHGIACGGDVVEAAMRHCGVPETLRHDLVVREAEHLKPLEVTWAGLREGQGGEEVPVLVGERL